MHTSPSRPVPTPKRPIQVDSAGLWTICSGSRWENFPTLRKIPRRAGLRATTNSRIAAANASGKVLAPVPLEDIMRTSILERRDRAAEHVITTDLHLVASAHTLDGFAFQLGDE